MAVGPGDDIVVTMEVTIHGLYDVGVSNWDCNLKPSYCNDYPVKEYRKSFVIPEKQERNFYFCHSKWVIKKNLFKKIY